MTTSGFERTSAFKPVRSVTAGMINNAPLAPTVNALRRGGRDPHGYLDELEARVEAIEPDVHALATNPAWDQLHRSVTDLQERMPDSAQRPPLFGIPVGVKDIFHVDGLPTQAGTTLPANAFSGPEAAVVDQLREAGAVILAKTVTTEFAYFDPGPTRNPHNLQHTPGGSSSGSAAAVAAGLCPLAIGSQTVGSTIRPAAFCGIVGFKPSFGRIPTHGVVPLAESLDHVGLFTQDIAGMRVAAAITCRDWRTLPQPDTRPVVGVPRGAYLEQASEAGLRAFKNQLDSLESAGYEVRREPAFSDIEAVNDRHDDLLAAEAALAHRDWFGAYEDRYSKTMADTVRRGREVTVDRMADTRAARLDLRRELTDRMVDTGIDLWVAPAAPGPAPEGIDSTGDPVMNLPWTNAGVPVVTLPAGTVDGLPVGLQVTAPYMAGEQLLDWAESMATTLRKAH